MSRRRWNEEKTFESIIADFTLQYDDLEHIKDSIQSAFNRGLAGDRDRKAFLYHPVKMLNTHLMVVPTGSESGRFVALDLGGTNLRILAISIKDKALSPESVSFQVPPSIQTGSGEQLFDFIAARIDEAFVKLGFSDVRVEYMGFTFSFPCHQTALNRGTLLRWTKGYSASDVVQRDVVGLLREACHNRGLKINDFILINDTTGTLLSGAFEHNGCTIGVINGTGTNACYMEKVEAVTAIEATPDDDFVLINTEWGSFGENHELDTICTEFDSLVDQQSINPGCQIYEKMISGMYVGEIVRHVLIAGIREGIFFNGHLPENLESRNSFPTALTSDIYSKKTFITKFSQLFQYNLDNQQYKLLHKLCDVIIRRAAGLCAAGLSALIERSDRPFSIIAADGSMFTAHTKFKNYVERDIRKLIPSNLGFRIALVNDGSGKGAALAACVVEERYANIQNE